MKGHRPGVVESIVATATRALPPAEEAALQARGCDLDQTTENSVSAQNATKALVGLGREGISEAAKAVVGVPRGQRRLGQEAGGHGDDADAD